MFFEKEIDQNLIFWFLRAVSTKGLNMFFTLEIC